MDVDNNHDGHVAAIWEGDHAPSKCLHTKVSLGVSAHPSGGLSEGAQTSLALSAPRHRVTRLMYNHSRIFQVDLDRESMHFMHVIAPIKLPRESI